MNCCYSKKLIDKLLRLNRQTPDDKIDIMQVKRAIYYARRYHGSQMRQSGEPYYSHPIEVASMVADYCFKTDVIVTAILHDTIEDTLLTKEKIAALFGEKIATQVEDLTRIKDGGSKISSSEMVEMLYKEKKHDVLLIKLFDRLHNIQTISAKSPERTTKIVQETLKEFIVLAEYLTLPNISALIHQCIIDIDKTLYLDPQHTQTNFTFSFLKDYSPLCLIYQNVLHQNNN